MQRTRSYLRKIRQKNKLSITDVADEIGVDYSHLAGIERGRRNPSLEIACRLEKFFNVPVCTLLQRDEENDDANKLHTKRNYDTGTQDSK